jgi:hypothetical protein
MFVSGCTNVCHNDIDCLHSDLPVAEWCDKCLTEYRKTQERQQAQAQNQDQNGPVFFVEVVKNGDIIEGTVWTVPQAPVQVVYHYVAGEWVARYALRNGDRIALPTCFSSDPMPAVEFALEYALLDKGLAPPQE